jgi:hypothetical protein
MFITALLLLGIIYGRFHWTIKALLVVSSLLFCSFDYKAYQDTLGYPVFVSPPETFQFYFGLVQEPSRDPGKIYLWISIPNQKEPRVIEIPYSKRNRDTTASAKEKVKRGEQVYMSMKSKQGKGDADGNNGQPGEGKATGHSGNTVPYDLKDNVLDFVPPPDTVPKKE